MDFHKEIRTLKKLFLNSGYPSVVVDNIIKRFIDDKHCVKRSCDDLKCKHYLCLPYFGNVSDRFSKRFDQLCRSYNIENYRLVFKPFKVGHYFSLKSVIPKSLLSGVIYMYTCSSDLNGSSTYIGRTKRQLCIRVKEHGFADSNSAILHHRAHCDCSYSIDNFRILASSKNDYELSILEALYIKDWQPNLNNTIANKGQSIFLTLY